jgi:hypothetical protein
MVYLQTKIPCFGKLWNTLECVDYFRIVHGPLVYFVVSWYFMAFLVYFVDIWCVSPNCMLHHEKSGNPGCLVLPHYLRT